MCLKRAAASDVSPPRTKLAPAQNTPPPHLTPAVSAPFYTTPQTSVSFTTEMANLGRPHPISDYARVSHTNLYIKLVVL